MGEEPAVLLDDERKSGEKLALRAVESFPGPLDDGLRAGVHGPSAVATDGVVVISADGNRPPVDETHDRVDHALGIGAVSHVISEKSHPFASGALRVTKTRGQRLEIRVDVGQERNSHVLLRDDTKTARTTPADSRAKGRDRDRAERPAENLRP